MTTDATQPEFRAGYVALVGRPNVGKSTLLNALLGTKLSIVTATPQTTRQRVLGVLTRPTVQMVFLDTPGVIEPRYALQSRMLQQAMAAVGDADVIVVLVEARSPLRPRELALLDEVVAKRAERSLLVALNKIDKVDKQALLPMLAELGQRSQIAAIVPISARTGDGVGQLEQEIAVRLAPSPPYFPPDALSDQPERFFVAEMIRERVFSHFGDEVPFSTAVQVTEFDEQATPKLLIRADIVVERESQKGILIGRGGRGLKRVGQEARQEIERFLGKPVRLELWAKVKKKWRTDTQFLEEMGL